MSADHNSVMSAGRRAALEVLGILPRQDTPSPAPAAGGAPQRTAPSVAAETIDWASVVSEENARLGLEHLGSVPVATAEPHRHLASSGAIDWAAVVDAVNAEAGFTRRGANVDPRVAAMLDGSSAR